MAIIKHNERTIRKGCTGCGSTDLYWAHDTDGPNGRRWCSKHNSGNWTLIERDGSKHDCPARKSDDTNTNDTSDTNTPATETTETTDMPATDTKPTETTATAPADIAGINPQLLEALRILQEATTPAIDRNEVERIAREIIGGIVFPTNTVVIKDQVTREIEGDTHRQLASVIRALERQHVMMVGPAGTGKSTIAEQAAEALGLEYYSISLSPQTPASQIIGYLDANGNYVRTPFREAFEHGGLFHFDEIDNAHPSVLAVINAGTANGVMAFADGMVKKHPSFRCAASANTYGRGANREYVGRQAIDGATLDRFAVRTIEIDEALETAICHATGADATTVDRVLTFVRKARANAEREGLRVILSPRASVGICDLLMSGDTWEDAIDARMRRGLADDVWQKLIA